MNLFLAVEITANVQNATNVHMQLCLLFNRLRDYSEIEKKQLKKTKVVSKNLMMTQLNELIDIYENIIIKLFINRIGNSIGKTWNWKLPG